MEKSNTTPKSTENEMQEWVWREIKNETMMGPRREIRTLRVCTEEVR